MLTWHFALIIIDDDNDDVKGQCHTVTECAAGVGLQVAMTAQVTIDGVVVQLTFDVELLAEGPTRRSSVVINLVVLLTYPTNFFIYCSLPAGNSVPEVATHCVS